MKDFALSLLTDQQVRALIQEELEKFFAQNSISHQEEKIKSQVVDLDGLLLARPFLGSRSTIYKKVSKGLIPHSKQGKKLFFDLQIIDQWLLENKVKSPSEIEVEAANYLQQKNRR